MKTIQEIIKTDPKSVNDSIEWFGTSANEVEKQELKKPITKNEIQYLLNQLKK